MMTEASAYFSGAQQELRQVQDWLLRPSTETLEACPPALERAAIYLQDFLAQPHLCQSDPRLLNRVLTLASHIRSAERLLHSAATLHFARLRQITPET